MTNEEIRNAGEQVYGRVYSAARATKSDATAHRMACDASARVVHRAIKDRDGQAAADAAVSL